MRRLVTLPLFFVAIAHLLAADPVILPPGFDKAIPARSVGPGNMSGRITALAVVEDHPETIFVAAASGGVWKSVNGGTAWTPVLDEQDVSSIGDVAVAASDPNVVWVGTGESNARNSVSWGDGVYRSVDGGKSWKHCGLSDTHHIGKVVVHPKKPEVAYVAALGHVWGPNKERGLFKTEDGGATWQCVKFIDNETGFVDLVMDPTDAETLIAAAYRVRRDAFSGPNPVEMYGPSAGLYKTTDGGKTWAKLTKGLPNRPIGRCGLAIYRKDPRFVYAVVQTDKTDVRVVSGQPAKPSDHVDTGGIFVSSDKGETWKKVNDLCPRPFYFSKIRVDPNDPSIVYVCGVSLFASHDGGKTFRGAASGVHADAHALWIDPANSNHHLLGGDGGLYVTTDRGTHWEHFKNLPIAQFYGVGVDMRQPYRVYGGLQDNGSWGGASRTRYQDGVTTADWFKILGADGFQVAPDPNDNATVFAEMQYGRFRRVTVSAKPPREKTITPTPRPGAPPFRFNWNTPMLLSPHDSKIVYLGGNHLFRSFTRGDKWEMVGPDLTKGQPGPSANSGHTLTAIAESPRKAGVLYVGSDDGLVHVSRDAGGVWVNVSDKLPGVAAERWITRIECSPFDEGTAFLALSRHRNDDRKPYLFKTEDYGTTWKPLANDLPEGGPIHVVRCDPRNPNLLYVGTEFGLFVSVNSGAKWQRLRAGLPSAAVHDLRIHPRDRELAIGTHGRGVYILDAAPLQEVTAEIPAATAYLFEVKPAVKFEYRPARDLGPGKHFRVANPEYGATIYYQLKEQSTGAVALTIRGAEGKPLALLKAPNEAGLHRVQWNLKTSDDAKEVAAGEYTVELRYGDKVLTRKLRVETEKQTPPTTDED